MLPLKGHPTENWISVVRALASASAPPHPRGRESQVQWFSSLGGPFHTESLKTLLTKRICHPGGKKKDRNLPKESLVIFVSSLSASSGWLIEYYCGWQSTSFIFMLWYEVPSGIANTLNYMYTCTYIYKYMNLQQSTPPSVVLIDRLPDFWGVFKNITTSF